MDGLVPAHHALHAGPCVSDCGAQARHRGEKTPSRAPRGFCRSPCRKSDACCGIWSGNSRPLMQPSSTGRRGVAATSSAPANVTGASALGAHVKPGCSTRAVWSCTESSDLIPGTGGDSTGTPHDGTLVARLARADRSCGIERQLDPAGGRALRGQSLGRHQADAAAAPDRQHGPSQDRRLPPSPARASRRCSSRDGVAEEGHHAARDPGPTGGARGRGEGAVHHCRHAPQARPVTQKSR